MAKKFTTTLKEHKVPAKNQRRFAGRYAVADWLRKNRDTKPKEILDYLAFEFQNEKRWQVIERLHQAYNRFRGNEEREALQNAS